MSDEYVRREAAEVVTEPLIASALFDAAWAELLGACKYLCSGHVGVLLTDSGRAIICYCTKPRFARISVRRPDRPLAQSIKSKPAGAKLGGSHGSHIFNGAGLSIYSTHMLTIRCTKKLAKYLGAELC